MSEKPPPFIDAANYNGNTRNSIDALCGLMSTPGTCYISNVSNISYLTNEIEYSFVEVTCDHDMQYRLQAYGKEAIELHEAALENISKYHRWLFPSNHEPQPKAPSRH